MTTPIEAVNRLAQEADIDTSVDSRLGMTCLRCGLPKYTLNGCIEDYGSHEMPFRCRRCGMAERILNQCVEYGGHDMPPTLESLEQRLVALEELVAAKQYIAPPPTDTRIKSVLDE